MDMSFSFNKTAEKKSENAKKGNDDVYVAEFCYRQYNFTSTLQFDKPF